MNSATFRKWLMEHGCRVERHMAVKHKRAAISKVLVRRGSREAELPLAGSRKDLPSDVVLAIVDKLGLDRAELPGPKSRV